MKKTTKLQELFHSGRVFVIAGGGCALHARIAEEAGFECPTCPAPTPPRRSWASGTRG
ncbi:MAG: hypothetical protein U0531_06610 [Dehalococcoidia bacterium]